MEKLRADLHEQDTQLREDNAGTDWDTKLQVFNLPHRYFIEFRLHICMHVLYMYVRVYV
jgi:hypothetical protein